PGAEGVEEPGLFFAVRFVVHEFRIEPSGGVLDGLRVNREAAFAGDGETPDDVGGHVWIAAPFLPPAPAAVVVLEVVEALHAGGGDAIELAEVVFAFGMSRRGGAGFDATEHAARDISGIGADAAQGARDDRGGEKAAHGLLGAAVGIVDE